MALEYKIMAFLGHKSLNFWTKRLKFCMQVPKCKEDTHAKFQIPVFSIHPPLVKLTF